MRKIFWHNLLNNFQCSWEKRLWAKFYWFGAVLGLLTTPMNITFKQFYWFKKNQGSKFDGISYTVRTEWDIIFIKALKCRWCRYVGGPFYAWNFHLHAARTRIAFSWTQPAQLEGGFENEMRDTTVRGRWSDGRVRIMNGRCFAIATIPLIPETRGCAIQSNQKEIPNSQWS